ncbi:MAG: D-aminoacyl-tRNA deacylase [Candidatus Endonucleobacter bathymodioli]|uniref:D-aminoacyl-tRNA deacylase n=1 Tax=Candidatus Endonucleibacter bathymodioli TaxID=539814 RepID=A0AA90NVU8_9GAMM|nr:D-aminoacyl-tRNA deacylase [Candidatus Endonucleobacter bathymodioli]
MRGMIQRVQHAKVKVNDDIVGKVNSGLLLLLGIEKDNDHAKADKLLNKVISYRVFNDGIGKINLGLTDISGELLIVSQFTLIADTRKWLRPSVSSCARKLHNKVVTGHFGANMEATLLNNWPLTFMLKS